MTKFADDCFVAAARYSSFYAERKSCEEASKLRFGKPANIIWIQVFTKYNGIGNLVSKL